MILTSLDCESTGLDIYHGARPFLVTICQEVDGQVNEPFFYEWPVNPIDRQPIVPKKDLLEIQKIISKSDLLVGQNAKFDVGVLTLLFQDNSLAFSWPWDRTRDTLIAGHLLASNVRHDLTAATVMYLGENIAPLEEAVRKACMSARIKAKRGFPDWKIAQKGEPLTPSAKEKTWAFDMWLPRLMAKKLNLEESHPWWTVTSNYANTDSVTTLFLWKVMEKKIKGRSLWKIFLERMKLPPIALEMEMNGVTISAPRCQQLISRFKHEAADAVETCVNVASSYDYDLKVPKSGNNRSLLDFCFEGYKIDCTECGRTQSINKKQLEQFYNKEILSQCPSCGGTRETLKLSNSKYIDLPGGKVGANGYPSLDKGSLDDYELLFPDHSRQKTFIKALKSKRKRDTAINYLQGYSNFWLPFEDDGFCLMHPSFNQTGTDTLRWSSSKPNAQNVCRDEDFNIRYAFGPEPGRVWYCMDGQNLELRIPAYEAGEEDLIYVFEHPEEAPYFGSYHLVVFDLIYPELFKKHGKKVKDHPSTAGIYTRVKSGNFAVIYGCQECKADLTYGIPGSFQKIRYRFPKIAALADKQKKFASKHGHVLTIPDKLVDPEHGYPILCTRTEQGYVLSTVPLNYHVQSSACWWMASCMISCHNQLKEWQKKGFDGYLTLQVHDELVFSMPSDCELWRIAKLKSLMEASGDRIGVPTPVSVKRHEENWAEGVEVAARELQFARRIHESPPAMSQTP